MVRKLRIAQVAPLFESVPPRTYGGTERVVSYLTEELVRQGHDVTLFASGDSRCSARLVAPWPRSLRTDESVRDPMVAHVVMLEMLAKRAHDFDIIHSHIDYLSYPLLRRLEVPTVTTLHGRLDLPELQPLYAEFMDQPLVSISYAQREPLPHVRWVGNVHHGLPADRYRFHPEAGSYLAFLGRISPEKRVDAAIRIAREVGLPLKIAAKIDKVDRDYFDAEIRPLLDSELIEYVGEIGESEKEEFLGGALALLFPIDWPEPFGLVMIEAMACGTPVIARRRGSVPEVMVEGVTGAVVESEAQAMEAVRRIDAIDRRRCREVFEERYDAQTMAEGYLKVYDSLLQPSVRRRPSVEMVRRPHVAPGIRAFQGRL